MGLLGKRNLPDRNKYYFIQFHGNRQRDNNCRLRCDLYRNCISKTIRLRNGDRHRNIQFGNHGYNKRNTCNRSHLHRMDLHGKRNLPDRNNQNFIQLHGNRRCNSDCKL